MKEETMRCNKKSAPGKMIEALVPLCWNAFAQFNMENREILGIFLFYQKQWHKVSFLIGFFDLLIYKEVFVKNCCL